MRLFRKWVPAVIALLASPSLASACSVCFGQPESPMAKGIVSGIWLLLLVVMGVLAGIVTFFVYMIRRSSAMAQAQPFENPQPAE